MRLGLTYNLKPADPLPEGVPTDLHEELDSEETIAALEAALRKQGHHVVRLGAGPALLEALGRSTRGGLDGVFNLAEGLGGRGREAQVPALLDMLGIPYTASGPLTFALTLDKAVAKIIARGHGIRTAPFAVIAGEDDLEGLALRYPLFAKPVAEGSSMGVHASSLCPDEAALRAVIGPLLRDYRQPVLVEEYLPGDEFTVGVVGTGEDAEVVGSMQILPTQPREHFVYSLEVKRDDFRQVRFVMSRELLCAGQLRQEQVDELHAMALAVHRVFECRDVSRVDIRCDREGRPNFLEVNALPGMKPGHSDLVSVAVGHGWSFERLLARIVGSATARWQSEQRSPASQYSAAGASATESPDHAGRARRM